MRRVKASSGGYTNEMYYRRNCSSTALEYFMCRLDKCIRGYNESRIKIIIRCNEFGEVPAVSGDHNITVQENIRISQADITS